jgi:hypothetical protein
VSTGYSRVWIRDVCIRVLMCLKGKIWGAECDGAVEKDKKWVVGSVKRV